MTDARVAKHAREVLRDNPPVHFAEVPALAREVLRDIHYTYVEVEALAREVLRDQPALGRVLAWRLGW